MKFNWLWLIPLGWVGLMVTIVIMWISKSSIWEIVAVVALSGWYLEYQRRREREGEY